MRTQCQSLAKTKVLEYCLKKIDRIIQTCPETFPHITQNGKWVTTRNGHWTCGFWVGILWIAYQLTGLYRYRDQCLKLMKIIEKRKNQPNADFDFGFLYTLSFVKGFEITCDLTLKEIVLQAAERLLTFYHNKAGLVYTIYNFKTKEYGKEVGTAIIDIMMNLELLWWAWKETEDRRYFEVVNTHAQNTIKLFIRPDGSTCHAVDFDLESGHIIRKCTIHGLHDESCWSRGQAWAIRGFFTAYHYSDERIYQRTAINLSNYYIDKNNGINIPPWDFEADLEQRQVADSSAAAITASAWLRWGDSDLVEQGRSCLTKLVNKHLRSASEDGILSQGCAYLKKGIGVNEATIWGDYYLMESILSFFRPEANGKSQVN